MKKRFESASPSQRFKDGKSHLAKIEGSVEFANVTWRELKEGDITYNKGWYFSNLILDEVFGEEVEVEYFIVEVPYVDYDSIIRAKRLEDQAWNKTTFYGKTFEQWMEDTPYSMEQLRALCNRNIRPDNVPFAIIKTAKMDDSYYLSPPSKYDYEPVDLEVKHEDQYAPVVHVVKGNMGRTSAEVVLKDGSTTLHRGDLHDPVHRFEMRF